MVRLSEFEHWREQLWLRALEEHPDGLTQGQLAALVGMSPGHVSRRLARARMNKVPKELMRDFEFVESLNPMATHGCERHHLIKVGDVKVCLNCGKSGMDHASPFAETIPLPLSPSVKPPEQEPTRKQRRAKARDPRRQLTG